MIDRHAHEIASPVVPDPQDERDRIFRPAEPLRAPPARVGLELYRRYVGTTWHQRGQECTGFALAAVANYTLRKRLGDPDAPGVSRRMLYEMAQFYDGEAYAEGSTLRGALKGWRRVGVARDDLWPYVPGDEEGAVQGALTLKRLLDARTRRLLRYERIPTNDLRTMQQALAEGRALYACANYHVGWFRMYLPGVEPVIEQRPEDAMKGGHAFVVAGYDERGFWIHNSFGRGWGADGYALLPYADWQANGLDVWVIEAEAVAPAPAPVPVPAPQPATEPGDVPAYRALWPHLVVLRDDGCLSHTPPYEMDAGSVGTMLYLFQEQTKGWSRRRLAVFADGGYRPTAETIEGLLPLRERLMAQEIYPIFLVWETDWWADLAHEIELWLQRGGGHSGISPADPQASQALDRSIVKPLWSKLIERAQAACAEPGRAGRVLADAIAHKRRQKPFELHLVSAGAGDMLMMELLAHLPAPLTTLAALAPVATVARFEQTCAPMLSNGVLERMGVITQDEAAERADRTGPLAGSLASLVSHALAGLQAEVADAAATTAAPGGSGPEPILGLWQALQSDPRIARARADGRFESQPMPGLAHVALPFDAAVHEALVQGMLRAGSDRMRLQQDPLARAIAAARGPQV